MWVSRSMSRWVAPGWMFMPRNRFCSWPGALGLEQQAGVPVEHGLEQPEPLQVALEIAAGDTAEALEPEPEGAGVAYRIQDMTRRAPALRDAPCGNGPQLHVPCPGGEGHRGQ